MLSILLGSLVAFTLISTATPTGNGVIYLPEKITYSGLRFSTRRIRIEGKAFSFLT